MIVSSTTCLLGFLHVPHILQFITDVVMSAVLSFVRTATMTMMMMMMITVMVSMYIQLYLQQKITKIPNKSNMLSLHVITGLPLALMSVHAPIPAALVLCPLAERQQSTMTTGSVWIFVTVWYLLNG